MFPNQMMRPSLLGKGIGLAKGINWSSLLDGTQKTLGIINQAIPIIYQVKPIISNAKTMFKIADVINSPANDFKANLAISNVNHNINKPIFYI